MALETRAPGRVNLIGDHTDYQDGLVMPMAIQLETRVTGKPGGHRVLLRSPGFGDLVEVPADGSGGPDGRCPPGWGRYVAGVVWALAKEGRPAVGFEGTVSSTIPAGAGLSSSAALEVSVAVALHLAAGEEDWDPIEVAQACRRAEVEGAGVPCGIMDQVASAVGTPDGALLLDCQSLQHHPVALPRSHRIVVVDSGVPRALAGSAYPERRRATETAAAELGLPTLRQANPHEVEQLPEPLRSRARHVVTENRRVLAFEAALRAGDTSEAGRLLDDSHASIAIDFAASHPEVDRLCEQLRRQPGVEGARMTGGGFGGTVIALVAAHQAEALVTAMQPRRAFVAEPAEGAGEAWD